MLKFEGMKKKVIAGRENYEESDKARNLIFKAWEKNEIRRIYINDYNRRALGYIDQNTEEIVINDRCGLFKEEVDETIKSFIESIR